ncbi:hypothetical protein [Granulicella arctica]|uniref:hypothetical protein n=1 Tax=Granulicella arctica TaxID=940613 RepID=UPI0021E0C32B|nr:hypothetical protein [Granulicella arctica]
MQKMKPILFQASRVAAVTFLAAVTGFGLQAQQPATIASTSTYATQAYPALNLQAALKTPINIFDTDTSSSSSSSSTDTTDAVAAERFTLGESLQPPPRRRYGRPRYTDNMHNADGSNKYAFIVGGGFTLPTGGTHNTLKTNYNVQGGIGRNFNKNFAVIAQFDWANFGIQTNTLNTLLATYNQLGATDQNGDSLTQLGGSSHVWSFTLNPTYYFMGGEKSGAYVVAGAGFYHKTANFTIPAVGEYCDPYYGCYEYQANQSIDKYTSNAFGVNGGIGFTYKPSRFGNQKLYAEARYVFVDNSPKPYSLGSATNNYFNAFPQNSARTTYIPITFGIRF